MCGITGFIDFKQTSTLANLQAMTGSLQHRGPDGDGTWLHQSETGMIGLGHRRLSIIDLSTSAGQPMSYDELHLVFNGEIYNYQEIRDELIALGHEFKTHSDTEVILHAWREWGEAAVDRWRGMFAITLYDQKQNEVVFIRDRAGVKPLFYYQHNDLILFGSELKSLRLHPEFRKQLNPDAVASYLQYGYVAWPHCIYQTTYKLAPGHMIRIDLGSRQSTLRQYWNVYDYYDKPKLSLSLPEAVQYTEKILHESFQYRMVADVPVGVFLSGGYDSTCVTALLQQATSARIKTFTIGSVDEQLDEAPFAKVIAERLGTDHTEYYCTSAEALAIIPELPDYYDEPFADSSAVPTILVSRLARRQVTVALSADAGDEIFAGYNRYDYIARYGNKIAAIPAPVRKGMAYAMSKIPSERIPYLRKAYNFHGRYDKLKNLLQNPSPAELLKNLTLTFTDTEIQNLFSKPVQHLRTAHQTNKLEHGYDALAYMMGIDYQTYLTDDILQKVDRATMSAGLEGREPFLDQHIVEWAAQLPSDYKYHNGQKKYILKQIVHQYIPQNLMDRPKRGFAIPVAQWLFKELKPLVQTYLKKERLSRHQLFDADAVMQIVNAFYNGRTEKHLQVWYLLMFEMWYEKWMTNE